MKRKGFTLIELLMVVIIIGILVTMAIPNYFQSIERSKGTRSKIICDNLRKAELQYRAINGTFINDSGAFPILVSFDIPAILVTNNGDDGDWTYDVGGSTVDVCVVTATRNMTAPSAYQGATIQMTQDGVINVSNDVYQ